MVARAYITGSALSTVKITSSLNMKSAKFAKASPPMSNPKRITSDVACLFMICSFKSRGGSFIIPSGGGSNVRHVSGIISASRSIASIWSARIGMAQFPNAMAARPRSTTVSSAMFVVIEAITVFLRLL